MNKQAVKEIEILGEITSQLIYRSKSLRYSIEGGDDLTENLNQIAAALHYEIEMLKYKVMNSKELYARRSETIPDALKKQLVKRKEKIRVMPQQIAVDGGGKPCLFF